MLGNFVDARETLGEDLAMAAMRSKNIILGAEEKCHAHGGRFLPDGKVGRTGMVVRHAFVRALDLDFVQDRLKLANCAHVLPDMEKVLGGVTGELILRRAVVSIDRD